MCVLWCAHVRQILALNVAVNSHNTAWLTILISNQFLEIKVRQRDGGRRREGKGSETHTRAHTHTHNAIRTHTHTRARARFVCLSTSLPGRCVQANRQVWAVPAGLCRYAGTISVPLRSLSHCSECSSPLPSATVARDGEEV